MLLLIHFLSSIQYHYKKVLTFFGWSIANILPTWNDTKVQFSGIIFFLISNLGINYVILLKIESISITISSFGLLILPAVLVHYSRNFYWGHKVGVKRNPYILTSLKLLGLLLKFSSRISSKVCQFSVDNFFLLKY